MDLPTFLQTCATFVTGRAGISLFIVLIVGAAIKSASRHSMEPLAWTVGAGGCAFSAAWFGTYFWGGGGGGGFALLTHATSMIA